MKMDIDELKIIGIIVLVLLTLIGGIIHGANYLNKIICYAQADSYGIDVVQYGILEGCIVNWKGTKIAIEKIRVVD